MTEMLSINVPFYADPSQYRISSLPRPLVSQPTDVLIEVFAASINPVDVKLASGMFRLALALPFPFKLGYDCAGVVRDIGDGVTRIKVGDEVYARLPERDRGSWSEYAKCAENYVALKPQSLSFAEAAALPLASVTALQAFRKYNGSLTGKTVFIPAGLGGSGAFACQLAKNVFNAGKVITSVSTAKVDHVPHLLGTGVVDEVIDYRKNDPVEVIAAGSVDFVLDTTGQAMKFLPIVTPSTGLIVSISTSPSGTQLQESSFFKRPENPRLPWYVNLLLNTTDGMRKLVAAWYGVSYQYMFLESSSKDLDIMRQYVEEKKLVPIIGERVDFRAVEEVKAACEVIFRGQGGIGKTVIEIVREQN